MPYGKSTTARQSDRAAAALGEEAKALRVQGAPCRRVAFSTWLPPWLASASFRQLLLFTLDLSLKLCHRPGHRKLWLSAALSAFGLAAGAALGATPVPLRWGPRPNERG